MGFNASGNLVQGIAIAVHICISIPQHAAGFIDLAIAVVVDGVAFFGCTWIDGVIVVVAITPLQDMVVGHLAGLKTVVVVAIAVAV